MLSDRDEFQGQAPLASVLGGRRDGSASVDSNRDLLMTILGELVLPNGHEAWTQTVLAVMAALDVRDKSARQAMARMHDRGWLHRSRVGRQTRWSLSESSTDVLEQGAARIYSFGQEPQQWDGQWLVLLASVPERDRHLRYRMANGLRWAGFGPLGQGTWVSPWLDHEADAVQLLGELGISATSFRSELGQLGSAAAVVDQAWDLAGLRDRYELFLAETATANTADSAATGDLAAAELVALVHRWRRLPFLDPGLPTELLPADWPATQAAQRFASRRQELLGPATAWWSETDAGFTPASTP